MPNSDHRLAAIVFTDIVGYTRQMEENEPRTMQLLQRQREIVFPVVKSFNGEVIKELGDGLMMMFGSTVDAVRCAIRIQTLLRDEELTIRAGIHVGEVIFKEGDVFGSAVNVAARIQPLAPANGICISEDVRNQILNKTDIRMNSIGAHELKGIKEPMEIYEIVIEGITKPQNKGMKYFFSNLWNRRVIQVAGIYLVGAWLIRMAVSSFVSAKLLSPYLVDLSWVILLSLIPSVILLTYFHGKRRSGKWAKAELIGFPANLVLSVLLIVFLFKGKDLGAVTTSVTLEDEEGNKTERTIMKSEFRKKILVFQFENKSGDTSLNWLQYAFTVMIQNDADQDLFLETRNAMFFLQKLQNLGYNDGITSDLVLQKELATGIHYNHFLTGTFTRSDGRYIATTKLYRTQTGKLIAENQFTGEDVFRIVDDITLQFKKDLGIPESHIEATVDMPVSEIYTSSMEALKYSTNAILALNFNHGWDRSIQLMNRAIDEDPDFDGAYLWNFWQYLENNQGEKAKETVQFLMERLDRMPERDRYYIMYYYYLLNGEPEKVLNVCIQRTTLFPDDIEAHQQLADLYYQRNEFGSCIREYKTILALDPGRTSTLEQLGDMSIQMGNLDSAEYYYTLYSKAAPGEYGPYYDLGVLYIFMNDFEKAGKSLENAQIIAPGNVAVILILAGVQVLQGNMEKAEDNYIKALEASRSAQDSASVYFRMQEYYHYTGQVRRAIEFFNKGINRYSMYGSPLEIAQKSDDVAEYYVQCGKPEEGYRLLKQSEEQLGSHFRKVTAFGYMFYYIELGNADEAEKYLPDALQALDDFSIQVAMDEIYRAQGRIAELRKNYSSALEYYTKYHEMNPSDWDPQRWISTCQRELGDLKKAKKSLETALKYNPWDPKSNYEAALLYLEMGDRQKAGEHLGRTLEIWKNADTGYQPYEDALALKEKIR
ncbi:MAG: adenylate/guanylate cyclase domain-containing protein [Bacteroidales bacterium]|nr:adenylate/guanylate cyclase domain-containing protein [Bacteroidales bacterium]